MSGSRPIVRAGGEVASCGNLVRLAPLRSLLGVLAGAALVSSAGAATGYVVATQRTLTEPLAVVAAPLAPVEEVAAAAPVATAQQDVVMAAVLAPPPRPAQCPKTTAVDPAWMGVGPVAPPTPPEVPASLERRVSFWSRVWGELPDNYHLLVDDRRPWIVHAEVDCRDLFTAASLEEAKASCGGRLTQTRREVVAKLKKSWFKRDTLKDYDGSGALARKAYEHVIALQGRKDALTRAKSRAAPHLGHAEGLFALEEVPRIYARAAIVESLWRPEALSRSGAAGAYQFMPKTGAQYLLVDEGIVDERLDPLRSSWAAARYMHDMERQLESWPLTITAYNTGPARLKKVMKVRKTKDLGRIADAGTWGEFGFDGQNYYAQIVAIGRLTLSDPFEPQPVTGRALKVEEPASFTDIAACAETPVSLLAAANPALHDDVIAGRAQVPAGYVAYVPDEAARTALNLHSPR
jgi:Transglycosylase SLT domain